MEDIEEMSSVHESEFATFRAELDRRGPTPLGTKVECVQLKSWVAGLEGELANLTRRFATLERVTLEVGRAEASSKADGLALELVQVRAYVHSTLRMEYRREGNESSEPQLAFCHLQTELAEREKALRIATTEVGTLRALLETERQGSISNSIMERELVCLQHSHGRLREIAGDLGFDAVGDCAKSCLIAWAMFDLLVFFSAYFVSTHELCS